MKEWVLASHNAGKCEELNARLASENILVHPLSKFTDIPAEEPACTFVENAILKARYAAEISGLPALADDSGLCVPALGGAPGVYSARYAGEECIDQNNIDKLLSEMSGLEGADRAAFFISVIVFVRSSDDPTPIIAQGKWDGEILKSQIASQCYGYNPVFYIPALGKAAAEMSAQERNQHSHRGKAINALLKNF